MQIGHVTEIFSDALDTPKQRYTRLIMVILRVSRAGYKVGSDGWRGRDLSALIIIFLILDQVVVKTLSLEIAIVASLLVDLRGGIKPSVHLPF